MTGDPKPPAPVVRIQRLLPVSPEEVFAAWTDAGSLRQWLCPGAATVPVAEVDVRVGGHFRIMMRDHGKDFEHTGTYREVNPPRRLVFTWRSPATGGHETLVTVELRPHRKGTQMTLTHELLSDQRAADQHTHGWASIAEKLEAHLSGGGTR